MRSQAQCPAPRRSAYSATLRLLMQSMALCSTAQEAPLSATALTIPTVSSPYSHVCSSWLEPCPHSSFKIHISLPRLSPLEMPHFLAHHQHKHTHTHTHTLRHQVYELCIASFTTNYRTCLRLLFVCEHEVHMWPCVGHASPSAIHYIDCQSLVCWNQWKAHKWITM